MTVSPRPLLAVLALAAMPGSRALCAQDLQTAPPRPPQVTDSAIARGREVYHGSGACAACHGVDGVGTDSGPALTQGVWMHGPDTYEGILERVVHGVPKSWSTRDIPMPVRGWQTLDDEAAADVAAYVWEISHAWNGKKKRP